MIKVFDGMHLSNNSESSSAYTTSGSKILIDEYLEDIEYIEESLNFMMTNKMKEAKKCLEPRHENHPLCSLGFAILSSIEALLVFEKEKINEASIKCDLSVHLCRRNRRSAAILETIFMLDVVDKYSMEELITELFFASALLFQAIIGFINDDKFTSFIKSAYNINKAYRTFKFLFSVVERRSKIHVDHYLWEYFCAGTYNGYGLFNIIIALLPNKVATCLSFVGFQGELITGLEYLYLSYKKKTFLSMISGIGYCSFHYIVAHSIGLYSLKMDKASTMVDELFMQYPDSLLARYLTARKKLITGNLEECIKMNKQIIETKIEWEQFINVCYWELMWCYSIQCDWNASLIYASILSEKSKWSIVASSYFHMSLLLTMQDNAEELPNDISETIQKIIKNIGNTLRVFSGKSVPIEKFCMMRCDSYKRTSYLSIPFIEILYIYNWFEYIQNNKECYRKVFLKISQEYENQKSKNQFSENYFVTTLLLGACYRINQEYDLAIPLFEHIIENKMKISLSKYLCPSACLEMAVIYKTKNDIEKVKFYLDLSRKICVNYILEFKVLFRLKSFCISHNIS